MTTQAGGVDEWETPEPVCGAERALFGGLAGRAAGFPAQETVVLLQHIPIGTSPLGVIVVAVLVPGGALVGLMWPQRWRRARGATTNLQQ